MAANDNATGPEAPNPNSAASRTAAEEAALSEGRAARRTLAVRTAREVLISPGVLDSKRLSRLGPDGVAAFVIELRRSLPRPPPPARTKPARVASPSPTPAPSGKSHRNKALQQPLDGVVGWWEGPPSQRFEQIAYRRGLILGAFLVLGLVYAFIASGL